MLVKIGCDSLLLIARDGENVGEALRLVSALSQWIARKKFPATYTAATIIEACGEVLDCALWLEYRLALVNLCSADVGQPGAAVWLRGRKNVVVSQTAVEGPVSECTTWIATN